jgi:hypothetical protein
MNEYELAQLAGKVASLWLGIYYGAPWMVRAFRNQSAAWTQTMAMTGGVVGFITLQWLV